MVEVTRAFLALQLPEPIIRGATELQSRLRDALPFKGIRWVEPKNFHLTVRFFGNLEAGPLRRAAEVVGDFDHQFTPVSVRLAGVSAFPSIGRPQVFWVRLADRNGELAALVEELDQRLRAAGFGPPDKPWKSHLTLGRVAHGVRLRLGPEWSAGLTWTELEDTISAIALMQSQLRPQGPLYTALRTAHAGS